MTQESMVRQRSVLVFTATTCPKQMQEFCSHCGDQETVAHVCRYFDDGGASEAHRYLPDYALPNKDVDRMLEKLIADQRRGKFRVFDAWDACATCLRNMALMWTNRDESQHMVDGIVASNKPVTIAALWLIEPGLHGQCQPCLIAGHGRLTPQDMMQQMQSKQLYEIGGQP